MDVTELPISPDVFWPLVGLAGLLLALFAVFAILPKEARAKDAALEKLKAQMGLGGLHSALFLLAILFWAALFLLLFLSLVVSIVHSVGTALSDGAAEAVRRDVIVIAGLTATLGAVVALPFTLIRLTLIRDQTHISQEGLVTDRINQAVEGLGAEKSIDRLGRDISFEVDGQLARLFEWMDEPVRLPEVAVDLQRTAWSSYSQSQPNLEVRIGAIYSLERIANDSPRDHIQIMEIICAYIRENAPASSAMISPHEVHRNLSSGSEYSPPLDDHAIDAHPDFRRVCDGLNPTELNADALRDWSKKLPRPRADIQVAITVLGRRNNREIERSIGFCANLQATNLQGIRFEGNFEGANFSSCRMDGCELVGQHDGCNFSETSLQGADCSAVAADRSDFSRSDLSAAFFGAASIREARFWFATMIWTNFNGANLQAGDFFGANPRNVYAYPPSDLSFARFTNSRPSAFAGMFEGPTQGIWVDEKLITDLEPATLGELSANYVSELPDGKLWTTYCRELGFQMPFGVT